MPLTTFAWMVHCNNEGASGGIWQASLNWVMPWGAFGGQAWPAAPMPDLSPGTPVPTQLGDTLWPWKLQLGDWYRVTSTAGGHALLPLAVEAVSAPVDHLGIQQKIEDEIKAKTRDCTNPFSTEAAYLGDVVPRGASSLPHALAPLTHLPPTVAQDILGMCTIIRTDAAQQGGCLALAPAFSASMDAGEFRFKPDSVATVGDIIVITYVSENFVAGGATLDFTFQLITKTIDPARMANHGATATCELAGAETADIGVRETLVAKAFSPLEVFAPCLKSLAQLVTPNPPPGHTLATAAAILREAFGRGELRREKVRHPTQPDTTRYVAIWEKLDRGNEQRSLEIFKWIDSSGISDQHVLAMIEHLRKAYDLPLAARTVLAPLVVAVDPVQDRFTSKRGQEAICAASRLIGSQNARHLWAAWLATLALDYAKNTGDKFWHESPDFSAWYARLLGVLDDHTCAALLADEGRRALGGDLVANPSIFDMALVDARAMKTATEFAAMLSAPPVPAFIPILQIEAKIRMEDLRLGLTGQFRAETAEPLYGDERDLAVSLAGGGAPSNQELRGYAIAMATGYVLPQEKLNWQWLTNVAAQVWDGRNWKPIKAADQPAVMSDTVGATRVNGRDVISFTYSGMPLNGRLNSTDAGEIDPDGTDALDFYWPEGPNRWPTPLLAYGLKYWAVAAPIGNAGQILDPLHFDTDDRTLAPLTAAKFSGSALHYLCRVAPGKPVLSVADGLDGLAYELTDESRTRTYLTGLPGELGANDQQRIALIRPQGVDWRTDKPTEIKLIIRGPDGTPNVVERWLEADCAQRVDGSQYQKDPAAAGMSEEELRRLQTRYRDLLKPSAVKGRPSSPIKLASGPEELERRKNWPRHPAVRAFGIEVQLFKADGTPFWGGQFILKPVTNASAGYIAHGSVQVLADAASKAELVTDEALRVRLAPGAFARIDVHSLVPETFFAGDPGTARMSNLSNTGRYIDGGVDYRGFAAATHWVECLSVPVTAAVRAALLDDLAQRLTVRVDVNKVIAEIGQPAPIDASWIRGFLVQQHEWHWTGYPVAFPRSAGSGANLFDWAEPFIGTESLRNSLVDRVQTRLDVVHGWHFGGAGQLERLASAPLPSERGAKYIAFVVRPVRRFDSWLKRWDDVDNAILGCGMLIEAKLRWDDLALRLPPPDLKAAVPLVRTFTAVKRDDHGIVASTGNGAMLCLRDVLYRTDDMARYGGVGESIEVDLEETRFNEVYEIGPNPVYHAGPIEALGALNLPYTSVFNKAGEAAHSDATPSRSMNWRLVADRPFGLTNDLDRNAKVAQTAIIVRPTGHDVANYWVMAKVKLRRVYDPDPKWTTPAWVPSDPKQADIWNLGRRAEGDSWIPHDFCIELANGSLTSISFAPGPVLTTGTPAAGLRTRYLCTWHKGNWANTDHSLWGLQVQTQQLLEENGQWQITARYSPFETYKGSELNTKDPAPAPLKLTATGTIGKEVVTRLLVSDYSEPHWLTFIGMPYRSVELANETYWLTERDGNLRMMRTNSVYGNVKPIEDGESISRDLLVLPLNAADFGLNSNGYSREQVETNSFHLLLVFRRVDDVTTSGIGMPLGELAGVYKPTRRAISAGEPYPELVFVPFMKTPLKEFPEYVDCSAFLYRFHTPHDHTLGEIVDWEDLQKRMFPTKNQFGEGVEASVRWSPEYIGPLSVVKHGLWPAAIVKPGAMSGRRIEIRPAPVGGVPDKKKKPLVEIVLDPAIGWRVDAKKDNDLVSDDIRSGNCSISDGLELRLAGGRLFATLDDWHAEHSAAGSSPSVRFYDADGMRLPEPYTWTLVS